MSGHRVLLPTPVVPVVAGCSPTVGAAPADAGGAMAGPQGRGKQRRHRHTAAEWEDVKEAFKELYSQPDATLEDVKQKMENDCEFKASIRQYKVKIKEWGLRKYITASDMQILLAKRDKRTRDRGVETVFVVDGVKFAEDRLNRFGKRKLAEPIDYVSPSSATPAGVCYYTPQSIIDAESSHVDTDDVFILQNAHHFRKVSPITTVQACREPVRAPHGDAAASLTHPHQAAEQGIACRGRFSDGAKATQLLWQARSFSIGLAKIMLEPGAAATPAPTRWSDQASAPQFWVSPQAPEGPGHARAQRLVECVKSAILCKRLFGIERHDSARWLGNWRLMNETEVFNIETAGRLTFGNPSLPYPEMEIFTLSVKFDKSTAKPSGNLLRICFCVDPDPERQDCRRCHSTCLVLDYMDPEGAVKLNVPLFRSDQQDFDWTQFQHKICTDKTIIESTWRDVNYIYQGMTHALADCKRHKMTKTNVKICYDYDSEEDSEQETWDTEGRSDLTFFEPFPPLAKSWICSKSDSLEAAEWWNSEEDPLVSDEDVFEPFATD